MDYSKACRQTVTLYNAYKLGNTTMFKKTIINNSAFLESKRVYQEGKTGVTAANSSLLVIPQGADEKTYVSPVEFDAAVDKSGIFTLRDSDKVLHGVGPDIADAKAWARFTPSASPGLVIISTVDVKRNLDGDIVHLEAGG